MSNPTIVVPKIDLRNGEMSSNINLVAALLIDPVSGLPVTPGSGGSGGSSTIDFELLLIQDAGGVQGIRRETYDGSTVTVSYEKLDGTSWVPTMPVTLVSPALPPNAATAAAQATLLTAVQAVLAAVKMPTYSAVTILSAVTSTTAGTPVLFGDNACSALDITNNTGVDIEYRRNATGLYMPIASGSSRLVTGITNANQIGIRRVDQSTTAVTVKAEAFAV